MKKFLLRLVLAFGLGVVFPVSILAIRFVAARSMVDETFRIDPSVEYLFVGTSHTGCTWHEGEAYRNRVLWRAASPFIFTLCRLKELARRGELARIKACIIDCDYTAIEALTTKRLERQFVEGVPWTWRYTKELPVNHIRLLSQVCWNPFASWKMRGRLPDEEIPWTERTIESRKHHLARNYSNSTPWMSQGMCPDWERYLLSWVDQCRQLCKEKGIRLILFASPLVAENPYRCDPLRRKKVDEMIAKIRALGVEYIDFRESCPDDYFRDSHHLSRKGSGKFTTLFYKTVLAEKPEARGCFGAK